ncbi:MAG: DUF3459 domain-containing protein, partial [Myxococcales bacterium]|nr:DUF3459 domain-containing protein [Myxococcales bacterium]
REAHARGIRVVTDLVLNHTSDQHPWFLDSRASTSATKRDWYIWRPDHEGKPPNNWASIFEPSAWTLPARTGMHYYHAFYEAQPDLNLRNPEVERELLDVVRFWLARGVDGFRLDAIAHLYEDESFRDNPWSETLRPGGHGEHEQIHAHTMFQPECHDFLRKVREVADTFPGERVLISEAYTDDAAGLLPYYGAKGEEIQLPFNFQLMRATKLDAAELRGLVGEVEKSLDGRPTTWVLGNHDQPRPIDRFAPTHAPAATRTRIAKTLATLLLTLRGSPFLYYGDELGMVTTDPKRLADVQDPVGKRYWPANKGRDGERTPMQWDASPEAGFTTGTPWLPVPKGARTTNVAVERNDSASIWNFYRELIALRRRHPALTHGALHLLETDDAVFAYERATSDERIVVAINTAATTRTLVLQGSANVLLSNARERDATLEQSVSLAPNEAVLLMLRD